MDALSSTGFYVPVDATLANLDLQARVRRLEWDIHRALGCLTHVRNSATLTKPDRAWIDRALVELGCDADELDTAHECFAAERNAVLADDATAEDAHRREWLATEHLDSTERSNRPRRLRRSLHPPAQESVMSNNPANAAPDPALRAIADCRRAWKAYGIALSRRDDPQTTEGDATLEASVAAAADVWEAAWRRVLTVTPTTIPGAAALAAYMAAHSTEACGDNLAEEALNALAASLRNFAAAA